MSRRAIVGLFLITVAVLCGAKGGAQTSSPPGPLLANDLLVNTASSRLFGTTAPGIAFDGNRYLVVWAQLGAQSDDVYGRFVDTAGNADAPFVIASRPQSEVYPSVAFNGSLYLVVWFDTGAPDNGTRARAVSTSGELRGTELLVSSKPLLSVASDGNHFLLVGDVGNEIRGQRVAVDASGRPSLAGSSFAISPPGGYVFFPAVAFGRTRYLVTWTRDTAMNVGDFDVYGALVSSSGAVESPLPISAAPAAQGTRPAGISFGTAHFLVAFRDQRPLTTGSTAVRVSEDGHVLDGDGIRVPTLGFHPTHPTVGFNGTDWLIVHDTAFSPRIVRIASDGTARDAQPVKASKGSYETMNPAIAFDGTNSLLLWVVGEGQNPTPGGLSYPVMAQLIGDKQSADLFITSTESRDPVLVNESITYTLTVGNAGPAPASNVVVNNTLPADATLVSSATTRGSCTSTQQAVACSVGALAVGDSAVITVELKRSSAGTVTNTATVSSTSVNDPIDGNNSTTQTTTVLAAADLSLTLTAVDESVVHTELVYVAAVSNLGPSTATGVVLTDELPPLVTLVSVQATQGSCSGTTTVACALADVAAGATVSVSITVRPTATGVVVNTASVTSGVTDPNDGNSQASRSTVIEPGPLATLVISPSSSTITAGASQAYQVSGSDAYGNSLGDVTASTTFTVAPDGGCTAATCMATAAGAHLVTAVNGPVSTTAALTVMPGPLATIQISPSSASIVSGQGQTYVVTGADAFGNSLGDVTSGTTLTITPSGSCAAATCTATLGGAHTVMAANGAATAAAVLTVTNTAPICSAAVPSVTEIWTPDGRFVPVAITGVEDADHDALTVIVTGIFQDEPTSPSTAANAGADATGVGTSGATVRAQRNGAGDGRVYHIQFTADDGRGGSCSGEVRVSVPHSRGQGPAVGGGALYDSTVASRRL